MMMMLMMLMIMVVEEHVDNDDAKIQEHLGGLIM